MYKQLSEIDHILQRSEIFVGSTVPSLQNTFVVDKDFNQITSKDVTFSDAFIKIFVEVLSNVTDNIIKSETTKTPCTFCKIEINSSMIKVKNDGCIISIDKIENSFGKYNHELIFGTLRTSSNYDDDIERNVSGKNGLGVKCTNIFSSMFKVIGEDPNYKLVLEQTWTNNMKETSGPIVKKKEVKKGTTEVIFEPDFKKFNMKCIDERILSILRKYVLDLAAFNTNVKVIFNGFQIKIPSFETYVNKFGSFEFLKIMNTNEVGNIISTCYIGFSANGVFGHGHGTKPISFVNGLFTSHGGKHVDCWTKDFYSLMVDSLKKYNVSKKDLTPYFKFFVKSNVDRPIFESQNKNQLKQPNITCSIPKNIITKVKKLTGFTDLLKRIEQKQEVLVKKNLNQQLRTSLQIKDYDKANNAGTKLKKDCSLIICEGLSAKTFSVAGISTGVFGKKGRDWYGIFPIRGKFLNVRNATNTRLGQNAIISQLCQILGLSYGVKYKDSGLLNYGKVIIISDPDTDGIHIEGLILNFFHVYFPTLLDLNFIFSMKIPIITVDLGNGKRLDDGSRPSQKFFYDIENFNRSDYTKYTIKYFKGLGTTNYHEVGQFFGKKMVQYSNSDDIKTQTTFDKAFKLSEANDRKTWIIESINNNHHSLIDFDKPLELLNVEVVDFIDSELVKFSIEDCERSLPHVVDGLKESQRKILYASKLFWSSSNKHIKVAQLGAFVAQKTDYKHGENNLFETIIRMAQNFVGSNNIPYFEQDGQFGTRLYGGKDAANSRYIFVNNSKTIKLIFKKEDDPILLKKEDAEPQFYLPIVPIILINGSIGIGTGFSSNIPLFNPLEIIDHVKLWIDYKESKVVLQKPRFSLKPFLNKSASLIYKTEPQKYESHGILNKTEYGYDVVELPYFMWTEKYKEILESLQEQKLIKYFKNYSTIDSVLFNVYTENEMDIWDFKLVSVINTSNMTVFDSKNNIKRFQTCNAIIHEFCKVRYYFYTVRKQYILETLEKDLLLQNEKLRFIQYVMDEKIKVFKMPKATIINQLESFSFTLIDIHLNTPLVNFSEDKIIELELKIKIIEDSIFKLKNKSEGMIWKEELEQLKSELLKST